MSLTVIPLHGMSKYHADCCKHNYICQSYLSKAGENKVDKRDISVLLLKIFHMFAQDIYIYVCVCVSHCLVCVYEYAYMKMPEVSDQRLPL